MGKTGIQKPYIIIRRITTCCFPHILRKKSMIIIRINGMGIIIASSSKNKGIGMNFISKNPIVMFPIIRHGSMSKILLYRLRS